MLTSKQQVVLECIQSFTQNTGRQPTLAEIGSKLELGESGIHKHVRNLIAQGYLQESKGKAAYRLPDEPKNTTSLPLLGSIAAGKPIEAIANELNIDLAENFCGPDRYVLRVSGDSMIDAGILNGDYVVIRKQETASRGSIVVALINQLEATLKYFHPHETGVIELRPANNTMQPMFYPADQVELQGILIGSFRGYQISPN